MLQPGDIYVALKGATKDGSMIGSVARVPASVPSGRLTQDTAKLEFRIRDPHVQRYLYWILRTPDCRAYCAGRQRGTTAASLGREDFLRYPVPPMTGSRRRTAELLEALDDKIELNRRKSQTLESMARALFKSWFVEFDPVRAKAEGRDLKIVGDVPHLFAGSFSSSEIGQIPAGWGVRPLGDLLSLQKGLSYNGAGLSETGIPMLTLGCFGPGGVFLEAGLKNYSGDYRDRHTIRAGDLAIANTDITQRREVLGSPVLVPPFSGADEILFTHHVFAARFLPGTGPIWHLYVY
jgi:hypothetical protein